MNRQHLKSFLHGNLISMIGVGVLGIMNYFVRRTLYLNLSSIDYGLIYGAFAVVMTVLIFLDLGLGQSATILLARSFAADDLPQAKKIFSLTFVSRLLLALLVLLVLEALAPLVARHYFAYPAGTVLLSVLLLLILTQTLESVLLSVITARKAFLAQQILTNLKILIILVGIALGARLYGVEFAAICFVAGSVCFTALAWRLIKAYGVGLLPFRELDVPALKGVFAFSSWIAVSTAGVSVMYYMDTMCLTWLKGLNSVAMYNVALPIMQIAQSFFVFPGIFTPFVVDMWHHEDYRGVKRSCYIGSLLMLLTLPVFLLVGIYFAPDVITLLFDRKSVPAAPAVTILWCGMVFFSIANFNINALNSGNRQRRVAYMVIACVVVNFVLNVALIPRFSYTGAALATAITYSIMALGSVVILTFDEKLRKH